MAALLCSNARVELVKPKDEEERKKLGSEGTWQPRGNSSEAPIVVAAMKIGMDPDKANDPDKGQFPRMFEVPFSSARKMMLTCADCSRQTAMEGLPLPEGSKALVCVKGAPDRVLKVCTHWSLRNGSVEELTDEKRDMVMNANNSFASQALRVLAIAVAPLPALPFDHKDEDIGAEDRLEYLCKDLTFIGLVANFDPPRQGVADAVLEAKGGHLRVIMITGDYLKTAVAVAKSINIVDKSDDESKAVDCGRLRPDGKNYIADSEMDLLTKKMCVFARAQPEDKLQIVKSLQRQNKVSAMTGDGVNDAPALNAAEIGVAMGIQGTEVAKGASAMILTDDNFCSIVKAVDKGRVIYAGIQKFVAFIMSVHIAEVMQIFFCVCVEFPLMREPVQILFLILVTDLPPSVALGMEPGQPGIMEEWPRPREQNIVLMWMWISIVMNGAILSLVIIIVFIWALNFYVGETNALVISKAISALKDQMAADGLEVPDKTEIDMNLERARTVAFISLVWSENVRAYVSRSFDRPIWVEMFANVKMQYAIGAAQLALYGAIFIPGLSDTILKLHGSKIGWEGWVAAAAGAVGCLVLCEVFKLVTGWQKTKFDDEERRIAKEEEDKRTQLIEADAKKSANTKPEFSAPAPVAPPAAKVVEVKKPEPIKDNNKRDTFDSVVAAEPNGYPTKGTSAGLCCPMGAFW
jgi:magnesium-transporting ATPase (P-type)